MRRQTTRTPSAADAEAATRRTRSAESLLELIPEGQNPTGYLLHLSREHDLEFVRGEGGVRLYAFAEVRDARHDCEDTCGEQPSFVRRTAALNQRQEQAAQTRAAKKAKEAQAAADAKRTSRSNGATKRIASERELVDATARRTGLVATRHIAAAYQRFASSATGNATDAVSPSFLLMLKNHGLQPADKEGRCILYRPDQVDAVAASRGVNRVKPWPEWVRTTVA